MIAEVLVEYNAKSIDKSFFYLIPSSLKNKITKGMKVKVPFGNKLINGFVINITNEQPHNYELKSIDSIVDDFLILNDELLLIGNYLQEKTLCTKITAYQTMLPSNLKIKDKHHNLIKYDIYISLNSSVEQVRSFINNNKRKIKQNEILTILLQKKQVLKKDYASNALNELIKNKLVKEEYIQKYRLEHHKNQDLIPPKLTIEQAKAVNKIYSYANKSKTILLHGVTGSGKTEVYMNLIEKVIKDGRNCLLLIPEITLTAQIVNRFYDRFGNIVAIFHSALSDGEKQDEYQKILNNQIKIVIGTRSAIFTPLTNIGIIIIDEEHSETYKQDSNPRYHALDIAIFRSNYHNCPLVLGSATPSLETMARAKKGVYELVTLNNRVGISSLPNITLVDMSLEMRKRNPIISSILKEKIIDRLNKKEQIILLLNRRGYSTTISCQNCGYVYKCPHCDISLTYHRSSNNLRCHYCGYTILKPLKCPSCHEEALNYLGLGTEKLENELVKMFPTARVIRMDTDTTSQKGSHEKIITKFKNQEYDILLGTQMISKGLDFPNVTLVGIINADASLNIPDFRSSERTFSLLTQASGRAGRANVPGEVIIQTYNPDNYTLNCVKNQNYEQFYNYEMKIRKKLSYPPYYYLVSIKVISKDYELAQKESQHVANYLQNHLENTTIILGPTTAAIFRKNNTYRFQILIKYKYDSKLYKTLKELDNIFVYLKNVYIEIDLNPNNI